MEPGRLFMIYISGNKMRLYHTGFDSPNKLKKFLKIWQFVFYTNFLAKFCRVTQPLIYLKFTAYNWHLPYNGLRVDTKA